MKTHKIEVSELQEWLKTEDKTFASSYRERKSLVVTLSGVLKVIVAGTVIWEGIHPLAAVEAYNAVTEKYVDTAKDFII